MTAVGDVVGEGRTSTVFAFGATSVVKVPKPHIPDGWLELEAAFVDAVASVGAPAPAVEAIVTVDGRQSVVFERIEGESMWDLWVRHPDERTALLQSFVELQRTIHALPIPEGVPDAVARMAAKIRDVEDVSGREVADADALLNRLPRGAAVLHGDLHPGNVIVGPAGLTAIDWFDVTVGHPIVDVVRTGLLLRPLPNPVEPLHLPGATSDLLQPLRAEYDAMFAEVLSGGDDAAWRAVAAVTRLSEAAEVEVDDLWSLWRERPETVS